MKDLLINGIDDPIRDNVAQQLFYIPNTGLAARSGYFFLSAKATTADLSWGTYGGRRGLVFNNSTANSVKLTYSLRPVTLKPEAFPIPPNPFSWTIAIWVYCGPEDFNGNIGTSNPNNYGQYLATINFLSKTAQEAGTTVDKRQMRIYIGRGSTTTLSLVVGRFRYSSSWTTIKINKSTNLTMDKGWHLVWVRPQTTRSTLVWGIDDQAFSNVTSFFSATDDWTEDFYIGSDICISSSNRTNSLPRGPLRVYKNIISTADLADLYNNDIW